MSDKKCKFCDTDDLRFNQNTKNFYCGQCFLVQKKPTFFIIDSLILGEPKIDVNGTSKHEPAIWSGRFTDDPNEKSCYDVPLCIEKKQKLDVIKSATSDASKCINNGFTSVDFLCHSSIVKGLITTQSKDSVGSSNDAIVIDSGHLADRF